MRSAGSSEFQLSKATSVPLAGQREDPGKHPDPALARFQAALQEPAGHQRRHGGERRRGVRAPAGLLNAPPPLVALHGRTLKQPVCRFYHRVMYSVFFLSSSSFSPNRIQLLSDVFPPCRLYFSPQ